MVQIMKNPKGTLLLATAAANEQICITNVRGAGRLEGAHQKGLLRNTATHNISKLQNKESHPVVPNDLHLICKHVFEPG